MTLRKVVFLSLRQVSLTLADGQYIDLTINPERFTGYAGDSAHHVWRAIYEENCFGLSEASMDTPSVAPSLSRGFGFEKLSEGWGTEMKSAKREDEMCEEKKVYYRVISGLLISSARICADGCRAACEYIHSHLPRLPRPTDRRMGAKLTMLHLSSRYTPGTLVERVLQRCPPPSSGCSSGTLPPSIRHRHRTGRPVIRRSFKESACWRQKGEGIASRGLEACRE